MADAEATLPAAEAEAPPELDAPAAETAEAPEAPAADAGAKAAPVKAPRKPRKGKAPAPEGEEAGAEGPSIAAHPRAAVAIARAKGWGALGGFVLGGYLSLPTHTVASAGLRAIIAGTVCYVAVWAGAVFFWRRMVVLEIKAREQQLLREAEAALTRRQAAAAQGAKAAARTQAAAQVVQETRPPLR